MFPDLHSSAPEEILVLKFLEASKSIKTSACEFLVLAAQMRVWHELLSALANDTIFSGEEFFNGIVEPRYNAGQAFFQFYKFFYKLHAPLSVVGKCV